MSPTVILTRILWLAFLLAVPAGLVGNRKPKQPN